MITVEQMIERLKLADPMAVVLSLDDEGELLPSDGPVVVDDYLFSVKAVRL